MSLLNLNRRGLLGSAGGLALAPHRAQAAAVDPFTLGVASGSQAADGFVLWTRLAIEPLALDGLGGMTGTVTVGWEISSDDAMTRIAARGHTQTNAALGYSVHVEAHGLKPGRPYWYRFTALGAQSETGRTRTLPAPTSQVSALKLALATCSHWETGYFSAYRHMADEDPDLVIFLGDYIYEYSYGGRKTPRRHNQRTDVKDLAGYRARYALHRTDPDLRRLHAVAPCAVNWDDHEVENDYAGAFAQELKVTEADFLARRAAAYRAFWENMPLRRTAMPAGPNMKLYNRFRYGALAEFTLPDSRQYRSRQACPTPGSRKGHVADCPDLTDPSRTMLGFEQERWMAAGFAKSTARWNLIPQGVLIADLVQKDKDGNLGRFTDGWSGHAAARQRMMDAVTRTKLKNPVFFTGDLHAFLAADLTTTAMQSGTPVAAAEFVATAVSSDSAPAEVADAQPLNPRIRHIENTTHGYISAALTPARLEVRFQAVSDRADPMATLSTVKRFVVEDGRPGIADG